MARPLMARLVARDIIREVSKGRNPKHGEIAIKRGYAPSSAHHGKAAHHPAYKKEMQTFLHKLELHRDRIIERMAATVDKATYNDLSTSLDRVTKVIQLTSGGATEHIAIAARQLNDNELKRIADGGDEGAGAA